MGKSIIFDIYTLVKDSRLNDIYNLNYPSNIQIPND